LPKSVLSFQFQYSVLINPDVFNQKTEAGQHQTAGFSSGGTQLCCIFLLTDEHFHLDFIKTSRPPHG
jgi:hypothetical protein